MNRRNLIFLTGFIGILLFLLYKQDWTLRMGDNLAYLVWRFWLTVKAFDQKLLWALFSMAVFIVLSFRIAREFKAIDHDSGPKPTSLPHNTITKWSEIFRKALKKRDDYAKWTLAESLFGLYATVYYERYGINQRQFKNLMQQGELDFPSKIQRYLLAGSNPYSSIETGSIFSMNRSAFPLEIDPEEVIKHLERLYERDF